MIILDKIECKSILLGCHNISNTRAMTEVTAELLYTQ